MQNIVLNVDKRKFCILKSRLLLKKTKITLYKILVEPVALYISHDKIGQNKSKSICNKNIKNL